MVNDIVQWKRFVLACSETAAAEQKTSQKGKMKANSQWIAHHTRSFHGLIRMNSHSHLFRNNNRASFFTWNKESASVSKQEKKEQQNKMLQKEIDVANKLKLITEPITNRRLSSIGCVQVSVISNVKRPVNYFCSSKLKSKKMIKFVLIWTYWSLGINTSKR
jgi:hypothetical protein